MALQNIGLILARTLWQYNFRHADGDLGRGCDGCPGEPAGKQRVDEFQLEATITSMSDGPYLVFHDRFEEG